MVWRQPGQRSSYPRAPARLTLGNQPASGPKRVGILHSQGKLQLPPSRPSAQQHPCFVLCDRGHPAVEGLAIAERCQGLHHPKRRVLHHLLNVDAWAGQGDATSDPRGSDDQPTPRVLTPLARFPDQSGSVFFARHTSRMPLLVQGCAGHYAPVDDRFCAIRRLPCPCRRLRKAPPRGRLPNRHGGQMPACAVGACA